MVTVFSDKEQWLSNEIRLLWIIVSNDGRESCIKIPDLLSDLEKTKQFLNAFMVIRFKLTQNSNRIVFTKSYVIKTQAVAVDRSIN